MKTNLFIVFGVMSIGIVVGLIVLFAIDPGGGPGPTDASNDSNEAAIETPAVPTTGSDDPNPIQTTDTSSVKDGEAALESIHDSSSVKDSAVVSVSETGGDSSPQAPPADIPTKDGEGFGLSNSVEFVVKDKDGNIKGQGGSK